MGLLLDGPTFKRISVLTFEKIHIILTVEFFPEGYFTMGRMRDLKKNDNWRVKAVVNG